MMTNDLMSAQLQLLQGPHAVHLLHALAKPVLDMANEGYCSILHYTEVKCSILQ